jgi:hypothetical protein
MRIADGNHERDVVAENTHDIQGAGRTANDFLVNTFDFPHSLGGVDHKITDGEHADLLSTDDKDANYGTLAYFTGRVQPPKKE